MLWIFCVTVETDTHKISRKILKNEQKNKFGNKKNLWGKKTKFFILKLS